MLALLLTVLGLALPVLAYLWNRDSPSPPLFPKHAQKSHKLSVASSSSDDSDSDNMPKATAHDHPPDPAASCSNPESAVPEIPTELENQPTQIIVRGDRAIRPLPQDTNRAPAARADLLTDGGMDISPQERRMLDAMATASSEMFQYIRTLARQFVEAEDPDIRLSVGAVCSYEQCGKPCWNEGRTKWTAKRCSGCLSNHYCSKECQKADWKPSAPGRLPKRVAHKEWCKIIKDEYMPQLPYFQGELLQFPWGRIERDGTFSHLFLRARFGVLDTDYRKVGFWAIPERLNPHDETDDPVYSPQRHARPLMHRDLQAYAHGKMMLDAEEWPSDVDGWKLANEALIPRLFFTAEVPPPARPRPGQVKDWKSWYEWRGLSLESPAAILMDHVLTTYYLLTETLKVVYPHRPQREKQVVDVHYLGAETELNYLPLFSELALLLPNTHINLTIFSPATHALLETATRQYPRSIAARAGPVWEYTAPRSTGGGSIAISLYRERPRPPIMLDLPVKVRPFTGAWDRSVHMFTPADPTAVVALNAGILSYSTWWEVVCLCTGENIPFACTDYAQQSAQLIADTVPIWTRDAGQEIARTGEPSSAYEYIRPRARPVAVNPFHRPGQRPISQVRSPNLGNGFICTIVGPT